MGNSSGVGRIKKLIVLLLCLTQLNITPEASIRQFIPLRSTPTEYRVFESERNAAGRRSLAPFQLCLLCKCCATGGDPTTCITMPCCFGIDCQLPNKPFGVCAFVPKTCNCTSCAMST